MWEPSPRSVSSCGEVQAAKCAASSRHVKDADACGEEKANVALEVAMRPLGPLSIAVSGAVEFAPSPSSPDGGVAARAIAAWPAIRKTARRETAIRGLRRLIRARLNNALHDRDSAGAPPRGSRAWEVSGGAARRY